MNRRLLLLILVLGGLAILGKVTGLTEQVTVASVRATVEAAGVWGLGLFLVAFCVGLFVQIPGMIFVAAAILAYGQVLGAIVGFVCGLIGVTVSFVLVRKLGGQALTQIRAAWVQKLLRNLDQNPIRVVIILRFIFFMVPPLNYTLALTSIGLRDYVIGSAIGLIPPLIFLSFMIELFV